MRRRSALSAIVLERLAGGLCAGWHKPPQRSGQGLAGSDVRGLEQPADAIRADGCEHRDGPMMVGDLNRLAVAHAADRGCQPVTKLPDTDLLGHCDHTLPLLWYRPETT